MDSSSSIRSDDRCAPDGYLNVIGNSRKEVALQSSRNDPKSKSGESGLAVAKQRGFGVLGDSRVVIGNDADGNGALRDVMLDTDNYVLHTSIRGNAEYVDPDDASTPSAIQAYASVSEMGSAGDDSQGGYRSLGASHLVYSGPGELYAIPDPGQPALYDAIKTSKCKTTFDKAGQISAVTRLPISLFLQSFLFTS